MTIRKIAALMLLLGACFVLASCDPVLHLNPKYSYTSFGLELGETVPADIEEYVDLSDASDEDRQFILENTEILYDGEPVKGQIFDSAGEHTLTIMYKGHQYRKYNIDIVDNDPPEFTETNDLTTYTGTVLSEEELESMFVVTDNSGDVKLSVSDMDVDYYTAGEYTVKAVAEDPSGNKAEAEATVTVENPHYGMHGTYIWVSIADQQLTYFVDDSVALSSPVVTGNAGNHDTPTGQYSVIYKARNVTLKGLEDNGDEYESFVKYWMAFIGSEYGMHDASWRSDFGGGIYRGDGSHGCINMPESQAAALYDMVAEGTPVFIY
ncbi:MAG: L,D-transpeptidase family protein [Mogibacterium sp.]|nr:L,D-transpeptidase family protein [Mogibacterium sp.]